MGTTSPEEDATTPVTAAVAPPVQAADAGPLPLDYSSAKPTGPKLWHVGTLTYTLGGLIALFFWLLLGDFAMSLRDRSVQSPVQLMLKKFNGSDTLNTFLLLIIPPVLSIVLAPTISYKSDRFRSRWGRRIPFLLIPTPIAAFSMIGLAFCPRLAYWLHEMLGANSPGVNKCALILFGVFWTCYEVAYVSANAVFGGLINDVVPRPVLGRFYGLFRAVSLIDGMIFNYWIYGHAEQHFTAIFIWIASVFGVGFTIMCFMVKEGEYPPPPAVSDDHRAGGFIAAAEVYLKECFSNRYYWWIFALFTLGSLTFMPINTFSVPYSKALNMENASYGKILFATYLFSLLFAYPLGALVDRLHSLRVAIGAMLLYCVSMLIGSFVITGPKSFGWTLWVHGILSGTYFTASASMAQALLPRMKFSQYWSAASMLTSVATVGLGFTLGPVLDWSGHNYRITYMVSCGFSMIALIVMAIVYRHFVRLGGPKHYVAPDSEEARTAGSHGFAVVVEKK